MTATSFERNSRVQVTRADAWVTRQGNVDREWMELSVKNPQRIESEVASGINLGPSIAPSKHSVPSTISAARATLAVSWYVAKMSIIKQSFGAICQAAADLAPIGLVTATALLQSGRYLSGGIVAIATLVTFFAGSWAESRTKSWRQETHEKIENRVQNHREWVERSLPTTGVRDHVDRLLKGGKTNQDALAATSSAVADIVGKSIGVLGTAAAIFPSTQIGSLLILGSGLIHWRLAWQGGRAVAAQREQLAEVQTAAERAGIGVAGAGAHLPAPQRADQIARHSSQVLAMNAVLKATKTSAERQGSFGLFLTGATTTTAVGLLLAYVPSGVLDGPVAVASAWTACRLARLFGRTGQALEELAEHSGRAITYWDTTRRLAGYLRQAPRDGDVIHTCANHLRKDLPQVAEPLPDRRIAAILERAKEHPVLCLAGGERSGKSKLLCEIAEFAARDGKTVFPLVPTDVSSYRGYSVKELMATLCVTVQPEVVLRELERVKVSSFSSIKDFDRPLGKEFAGGIDYSSRNLHRLILELARMSSADVVLLDEPHRCGFTTQAMHDYIQILEKRASNGGPKFVVTESLRKAAALFPKQLFLDNFGSMRAV